MSKKEFISKQDAIEQVEFGITYVTAYNTETGERHNLFESENRELEKAVDRIKKIRPADVVQARKKKPLFKRGESVAFVEYADGTGGAEVNKWADWVCPECGWFVGEQYIPRRHNQRKSNFCSQCGCGIDWSDTKKRSEET